MADLVRRSNEGLGARWDPFEMMREFLGWDPFQEMAPLAGRRERGIGFTPRVDVRETKDAYLFSMDVPGVEEKDLDISLTGNRLTISGERKAETKQEAESYYTYERSYGHFSRSFTLPEGADAENAEATLKNGVLELRVAKRPEVQAKKVKVKGTLEGVVSKVKGVLGKEEKPSA